ncbi:peptidoglycan editing factor PgeF [Paenibacillus alvei]|uniref:Purine nucleoside phosphorylase n=1 Tax=Paenibacillus alvei TaxID=44250 RepID=A0AAP6ZYQ1_PAEAL|nr:peptidoglycan editing factor PgeF [Paenibacillus alvei]MBG9734073.1 multicopper polyphenol oxidase [Paenibacillus alvei]MBG9744438.1 multicopper polyphenol oxidase [Paenibacillus alvei]MCY9582318.1 peptidoglycan editing factor PgeF [Paenibacillus alvei]MCY9587120.1 peptidoglycan editing factor PgeF [Paenibacillus alvei]NOJ69673.1 peptidoglycan editing factor PgeF [Paenibacillus alvei]
MEPFQLQKSKTSEGPVLLELKKWTDSYPELTAGFTTRNGGVSSEHFDSLNCALHVLDNEADVIHNRKLVAEACGMPFEAWTCGEQVHGSHVHVVTQNERGKGRMNRTDAIQNTDSLVTDVTGVLLASFYADCVPLMFLDPVQRVIGLAHAGWKGTVSNICAATVHKMQEQYGCRLEHIQAAIGPSIGSCCYEVDERVIAEVRRVFEGCQQAERVQDVVIRPTSVGHAMLDLRELNRHLLIEAGILAANIECTTLCTGCNIDMFYSHRMEGGTTGRMMSWIGWK